MCDGPYTNLLRGQKMYPSRIGGGAYCMRKNERAHLHLNIRLVALLPAEFPGGLLMTGISGLYAGSCLVVPSTGRR